MRDFIVSEDSMIRIPSVLELYCISYISCTKMVFQFPHHQRAYLPEIRAILLSSHDSSTPN
jgi:hypothetical protein